MLYRLASLLIADKTFLTLRAAKAAVSATTAGAYAIASAAIASAESSASVGASSKASSGASVSASTTVVSVSPIKVECLVRLFVMTRRLVRALKEILGGCFSCEVGLKGGAEV